MLSFSKPRQNERHQSQQTASSRSYDEISRPIWSKVDLVWRWSCPPRMFSIITHLPRPCQTCMSWFVQATSFLWFWKSKPKPVPQLLAQLPVPYYIIVDLETSQKTRTSCCLIRNSEPKTKTSFRKFLLHCYVQVWIILWINLCV